MSHQVWTRPFRESDRPQLVEWLYAHREENRFDPELFEKNQVTMFTCFDKDGIIGFVPVSAVFMLESLAFRPGLTKREEAKALEAVQHVLVQRAAERSVPDAYFVTFDEEVQKFAGLYGWRKVEVPMMTLHFSDLEKPCDSK